MTRISLATLVAATVAVATLAAQDPKKSGPPTKPPNHVTLTGCIRGGPEANTYIITKAPDALTAGINAATTGAVPTINYVLVGGQDFKPHVGHQVEITGRIDGIDELSVLKMTSDVVFTVHSGKRRLTSFFRARQGF